MRLIESIVETTLRLIGLIVKAVVTVVVVLGTIFLVPLAFDEPLEKIWKD